MLPVALFSRCSFSESYAAVWQAMEHFMKNIGASAGRGGYRRALAAEEIVFQCRRLLGKLFNINDATRIVFATNATEAINLVLKGWLNPGDHVITTAMEHNAVWRCLKTLEKEGPTALQIYKWLPGTNCRRCGQLTCLAFATRLLSGENALADCPPLAEEENSERFNALQGLLG
ncbi:aminotransferase class V-fold PLP-dependent enzyme [Moorella stamsii]|nr:MULTISPECIES: aminotransferase class V-fold PLP-dependent enzyme [Moorella]